MRLQWVIGISRVVITHMSVLVVGICAIGVMLVLIKVALVAVKALRKCF